MTPSKSTFDFTKDGKKKSKKPRLPKSNSRKIQTSSRQSKDSHLEQQLSPMTKGSNPAPLSEERKESKAQPKQKYMSLVRKGNNLQISIPDGTETAAMPSGQV